MDSAIGEPPLNTIRRLKQVPRETSKVVRIPWDSEGHGNTCVKWEGNGENPTKERPEGGGLGGWKN